MFGVEVEGGAGKEGEGVEIEGFGSAANAVTVAVVEGIDKLELGVVIKLDGAEGNGILYTCHAGHIDIAHARKAADWTGFLAAVTLEV